jgi:hypothetical protein
MSTGDTALDLAAARLDRALTSLEQKLADTATSGGLFDQDTSKLAAELAAAKIRERELEQAGAAASEALARAIQQIQDVLADKGQTVQAQA